MKKILIVIAPAIVSAIVAYLVIYKIEYKWITTVGKGVEPISSLSSSSAASISAFIWATVVFAAAVTIGLLFQLIPMRKVYLAAILSLLVLGAAGWFLFKEIGLASLSKTETSQIVAETRDFSCPGMEGFTFKYPVFDEWKKVEFSGEKLACALTYYYTGAPREFRQPPMQVSISYIAYQGESGQPPPPGFEKTNSQNVYYQQTKDGYEFWINQKLTGAIQINLPEGTDFPRALFSQTIIDSFRLTDATLKHYENSNFGISFDYPNDWNFSENGTAENTMEYNFSSPDNLKVKLQAGKELHTVVRKFPIGQPYSFIEPACQKDQRAGTLTINNKQYTRCDVGSGLHVYQVAFMEPYAQGHIYLEFNYNSADPNGRDTKTIEAIIQSFKF